jgi:hypothetical protein
MFVVKPSGHILSVIMLSVMALFKVVLLIWGAQKLTGDNLKFVWAEFSTLI